MKSDLSNFLGRTAGKLLFYIGIFLGVIILFSNVILGIIIGFLIAGYGRYLIFKANRRYGHVIYNGGNI